MKFSGVLWFFLAALTLVLFEETVVNAQEILLNVDLQIYQKLIEKNRKVPVSITVIDSSSKVLKNAYLECNQLSHEFLFGNAPEYLIFAYAPYFYRRGSRFGTRPISENDLEVYKKYYIELFNCATVPAFYWADYEPAEGFLPLIDATKKIVQWLNDNNIVVKGHTLVWGNAPGVGVPGWVRAKGANDEWKEVEELLHKRIVREVNEFKNEIHMWDVVNEPIVQRWFDNLGKNYIAESYKLAKQVDPDAELILNEFGLLTNNDTRQKFITLVRKLIDEKVPVDIIGVEAHIFNANDIKNQLTNLDKIYSALDEIAELGKPIHITEFQIPLSAVIEAFNVDVNTAEQLQAEIAKIFYTVFFSHPTVEAIVYWNFYRAWQVGSGFLRDDLTLKPIYYVLKDLIHKEWKTSISTQTDTNGIVIFTGFPGLYRINIKYAHQERTLDINVSKNKPNDFVIVLDKSDQE
ncbi:endo-1,4-beta-xylanase [Thermotoga profunda]|uniref:endo-1,4-beta-xylanase n=1 Tax=Thermotoga profunda TaxID=1508420 RepID=UPI000694BE70|nr:endo-1,4-beta-xylanase [Thermotoga profunda]